MMGSIYRFVGVMFLAILWAWISDTLRDIRDELKSIREKMDKK
jgi:hypothetical protein